eukprot:CAMPEP_0182849906 /NCGR_PEP_ID=MMETSP0006_2-20121128/29805_1 /TAXON_ID=97485 /ORGANISM="Prymnesium parvum, Strain Texoma1" /LENGTH=52 /DNA_ID=CAMNT_0024980465 /DNA_START=1382 /DNA_END=1540 /DNA_ORIENTATION=+
MAKLLQDHRGTCHFDPTFDARPVRMAQFSLLTAHMAKVDGGSDGAIVAGYEL